ncbi:MAG: hypothetical protein H7A21_18565 [Spirochaetales bacterium]|nr:hypothetical protein [Leptospiraceae bacterium]MCP5483446.1 hypothetical protein [Spirochaetales bacterium]MCP5486566.1 hypothetical protein [Spirochaetales bacterium]
MKDRPGTNRILLLAFGFLVCLAGIGIALKPFSVSWKGNALDYSGSWYLPTFVLVVCGLQIMRMGLRSS